MSGTEIGQARVGGAVPGGVEQEVQEMQVGAGWWGGMQGTGVTCRQGGLRSAEGVLFGAVARDGALGRVGLESLRSWVGQAVDAMGNHSGTREVCGVPRGRGDHGLGRGGMWK